MQRVGLHQEAVELDAIQQLAQSRDLASGIGGIMGAEQLVEGLAVELGKTLHPEQGILVAVGVSLPRSFRWPGSPPAASTTADSESPGAGGNREAP